MQEQTQELTQPEPVLPEIDQISQLIMGDEPQAEPEAEPEQEAAPEPVKPSIDYAQEVPLQSGDKVTLGELKDYYQAQASATLELQEREQSLTKQRGDIEHLLSTLQALPPEIVAKAQDDIKAQLQTEHVRMLEAIPAWKDQAAFEKGRGAIHALAAEYGVERIIGQVSDHRLVKMLHDYATLKAAVKAAGSNVKPIRSSDPKARAASPNSASGETEALIQKAKQTGQSADRMAAISKLIRG